MMPPSRRAGPAGPAVLALALLLAPAVASGQEIGTTRVTIAIDQDRVRIEMVLDPVPLLAKLERHASGRGSLDDDVEDRARRVRAHADDLLHQITLQFGNTLVPLRFDDVTALAGDVDTLSSGRLSVRLSGRVPADAHWFQWAYGLTYAPYVLVVRQRGPNHGDMERRAIVDGAQLSPPFDLARHTRAASAMLPVAWGAVFITFGVAMLRRGRDRLWQSRCEL